MDSTNVSRTLSLWFGGLAWPEQRVLVCWEHRPAQHPEPLRLTTLHSTSSKAVIKFCLMFPTHHIPYVIVSDNDPQFQCYEFADFAREYGILHQTLSLGHGEAKAGVKVTKKLLRQANPGLARLNYQMTPHSSTGVSPAVAVMGRDLCTKLPILPDNLIAKTA
ncbi:hypothetical protein BaRGS_00009719 [Batillaria attramentaria]|uniref:Integrase catalytic domain-containing protein n=1 Tax=Batillaria attramentaria TaxID=370345 RepID=A0ABD0LHY5_9CAEN